MNIITRYDLHINSWVLVITLSFIGTGVIDLCQVMHIGYCKKSLSTIEYVMINLLL